MLPHSSTAAKILYIVVTEQSSDLYSYPNCTDASAVILKPLFHISTHILFLVTRCHCSLSFFANKNLIIVSPGTDGCKNTGGTSESDFWPFKLAS